MEKKKKQKNKIKKINILPFAVIVIVILIIIIPLSFSKYVIQTEEIYVQKADSFYFDSSISDKTYNLEDWDITEEYTIDFNVINYENDLLYTDSDIIYNMELNVFDDEGNSTDAISAVVKNSDNEEITESQTLTGGKISEDTYSLVISSNFACEGDTFKIELTISATSPYEKNLTTVFDISVENEYIVSLTELDDEDYDILNIIVYETSEDIIFTYDNTIYSLDGSAEILQGASITEDNTITTVVISNEKVESDNSYIIYLIKIEDSE